jgi:hypothetical protein
MKHLNGFLKGLSYFVVAFIVVSVMAYFFEGFGELKSSNLGFELASVSAILGGLILASAGTAWHVVFRLKLRRVAIWYLLASVGFILFQLFLILTIQIESSLCAQLLYAISIILAILMISAALFFGLGTMWLIQIIPNLWRGD